MEWSLVGQIALLMTLAAILISLVVNNSLEAWSKNIGLQEKLKKMIDRGEL